mgnify:CR=1 FL=1
MATENKNDAITSQEEDFAQWYTDVCRKAELKDRLVCSFLRWSQSRILGQSLLRDLFLFGIKKKESSLAYTHFDVLFL